MKSLAVPLLLLALVLPASAQEQPKPSLTKFKVLAGVATTLMIADFETTQSCLHAHTCSESNFIFKHASSRADMYAIGGATNAALFAWSFERLEHHKRFWWLPAALVITAHAYGWQSGHTWGFRPPMPVFP